MPSNYTPNYQLNQWEAGDRVQRTDFNAGNAKIDAAIAAKCEIVTGAYTGDDAAEREIVLGRQPRAVFLTTEACTVADHGHISGLATAESPVIYNQKHVLTITETGFMVYYYRFSPSSYIGTNSENTNYRYVAFF